MLLAVRNKMRSQLLYAHNGISGNCHVMVKISSNDAKWIISLSYIPSAAPLTDYGSLSETLEDLYCQYSDHTFFVRGDLNLTRISWNSSEDALTCLKLPGCRTAVHEAAEVMVDLFSLLHLHQFYPDHPNKVYTLDLVFAAENSIKFLNSQNDIVPVDASHHMSATFVSTAFLTTYKRTHFHPSRFNFRRVDPKKVDYCLSFIDSYSRY